MRFLFVLVCCFSLVQGFSNTVGDTLRFPSVFVMDETSELFVEKLDDEYHNSMLKVFSGSLTETGDRVVDLVSSIENYATTMNFNIKGVRFYYNAYFREDGSIAYFAYMLRPESRNIDTNSLTAFLANFITKYKMKVPPKNSKKFSASGLTAYFPFFKGKVGGN